MRIGLAEALRIVLAGERGNNCFNVNVKENPGGKPGRKLVRLKHQGLVWQKHQGLLEEAWRCARQSVLTVFGAGWILLLAEAAFSKELAEEAWRCRRRLVLVVSMEVEVASALSSTTSVKQEREVGTVVV